MGADTPLRTPTTTPVTVPLERREAIFRVVAMNRPTPSWRAIAVAVGLRSSSTVGEHLRILVREGRLVQDATREHRILHVPPCDGRPWRPAKIGGHDALVVRFDGQ